MTDKVEIEIREGNPYTRNADGSMHRSTLIELVAELQFLRNENAALRNLAENLEPGPISQALANTLHAQSLEEPSAWLAEDGRIIKHELKTTLTPRSAVAAFTIPLFKSRHGGKALHWAVNQLLGELPERRDWLNPDVERTLRAEVGSPLPAARAQPGTLQVGVSVDEREVIINAPYTPDNGSGFVHFVFTPSQALGLAYSLINKSSACKT